MAIFRVPVNITWTGAGSPGVNVFHVRDDAWPGSTNLDGALTALSSAYALICQATNPTLAGGTKVTLGDIVELESGTYVQPGAAAWTDRTAGGTVTQAPAPVAIVCSWRTSLAARRGMGRSFFSPLSTTVMESNGTPNTGARDSVLAFGQAILDHNDTVGAANFGIYGAQSPLTDSQKQSGDYPRVLRDITGFRVRDQYAVLRSRRD